MPQIDRVNVASLTQLANVAGTHDRLVATAEGGIQTSGRVSAFFTAKATHRATAEAFLGAIRNRYGDGIADALAPQLNAMRRQGKPLKARVGHISSEAEFTPKTVATQDLRTVLVYEVRLNVEDPGNRLRLGQPVTVDFAP